jgi:hypothetical protein
MNIWHVVVVTYTRQHKRVLRPIFRVKFSTGLDVFGSGQRCSLTMEQCTRVILGTN